MGGKCRLLAPPAPPTCPHAHPHQSKKYWISTLNGGTTRTRASSSMTLMLVRPVTTGLGTTSSTPPMRMIHSRMQRTPVTITSEGSMKNGAQSSICYMWSPRSSGRSSLVCVMMPPHLASASVHTTLAHPLLPHPWWKCHPTLHTTFPATARFPWATVPLNSMMFFFLIFCWGTTSRQYS